MADAQLPLFITASSVAFESHYMKVPTVRRRFGIVKRSHLDNHLPTAHHGA